MKDSSSGDSDNRPNGDDKGLGSPSGLYEAAPIVSQAINGPAASTSRPFRSDCFKRRNLEYGVKMRLSGNDDGSCYMGRSNIRGAPWLST